MLPSDCLNGDFSPAKHPISQPTLLAQLIHFLQDELSIPAEAIAIARREETHLPNLLPMVLWQYGLISLEQLDQIFDWLDTVQSQTESIQLGMRSRQGSKLG
jgi:hypothetical protein